MSSLRAASADDLAYLRHTLGTLPSESGLAGYDRNINDDNYAYDSISFPALADVGEAFCRHALGL